MGAERQLSGIFLLPIKYACMDYQYNEERMSAVNTDDYLESCRFKHYESCRVCGKQDDDCECDKEDEDE